MAGLVQNGEGEFGNRAALRVAVIGAGMSGLAVCKQFVQNGFNVTVLEGKGGIGGVWRASYASTHLQSPRHTYAYSDFPWPENVPTFPSNHQVVHYLESYARHFNLFDRIRFNSQVVEIKRKPKSELGNNTENYRLEENGDEGVELDRLMKDHSNEAQDWELSGDFTWEVLVRKKEPGSFENHDQWLEFDFVIMCCGRYGDVANVPSFPASKESEAFDGKVLHALNYSALDSETTQQFFRGKNVVVVGFQKTSLDIAVEVAEINQRVMDGPPCTMVFRRAHWMYPKHKLAFGLFPFAHLWSTRLAEYWTPKPGQGSLQCLLQRVFYPVRFLVWKMLEYYLRCTVPVGQFGMVPEHSLFDDLSACILPQVPESLMGHLKGGRIVPRKTPHCEFYPGGVRLADDTEIEADIVILCTGYNGPSKLTSILPKEYREVVYERDGALLLYRGIIHPQIPNMGFVGYREGLSSVHSSEMSAVWLAQLLRKQFSVPDIATMEAERRSWLPHMKASTPFYTKSCVSTIQIWHTDKLCQDMGAKILRKKTWWQEVFSIYNNSDYRSLPSELISASVR